MSKIAFLFPGQGAQKAGMGQDFYEKYPSARQVFDQASQWLSLDMKAKKNIIIQHNILVNHGKKERVKQKCER